MDEDYKEILLSTGMPEDEVERVMEDPFVMETVEDR